MQLINNSENLSCKLSNKYHPCAAADDDDEPSSVADDDDVGGVADPIHMHEDNLSSEEGVELILSECIFPALQHNKDKKYILVPYNPT